MTATIHHGDCLDVWRKDTQMSTRLRVVPDLTEHQVHAGALRAEHKGRALTLADRNGSVIRGELFSVAPSLTMGRTVLKLLALGTIVTVTVPDADPIHVHPAQGDGGTL